MAKADCDLNLMISFMSSVYVRPSSLRKQAFDGQDYEAGASFSFSLPRVILRKKVKARPALQDFFFCTSLSLTRASSRRASAIQKKHNLMVVLLLSFVIRTGFEPVTHSLEGCCSIQLSYRTDPKVAAKIVIIFVSAIC